MGGSARWDVCAPTTPRCIVARKDAAEETSRSLIASDLRGRPGEMVPGHTLRGLVAVVIPDWKA
jgi:hypothetical protein